MYYFINEYILQKNSSVEHTAMNRVKLFNHYQEPAKIVTKIYDRLLHRTLTTFGLADNEVVNMFDFFQQAANVPTKVMRTDDLRLPVETEVVVGANFSQVLNGDDNLGRVGFIPGTIGRVFYHEHADNQGNLIETDLWDWRGFRSATQYFGQNGKLVLERYYTPTGQTALEIYSVPDTNGNPLVSRVILKDYQGQGDRFFQNQDDLFEFFLAELSKQDTGTTTFISDRPGTGVRPLLNLDDGSRKYIYLPINHAVAPDDPLHGDLDGFLKPAFEHFRHFDGFITGTEQQAEHLRTRFPEANVFDMPAVTMAPLAKDGSDEVAPTERRANSLLYVGRIAQDKQIDQLLRMFALVHDRVPGATFDLYGYGDHEYQKKMTDLVSELHLEHNVTFKDYDPELIQKYDTYQVLVNMSIADGGPMGMLEAMSHGIPVVSYPFNYGPKDLIVDGDNGYLVNRGNSLAMAEHVVELFSKPKALQTMSHAAYQTTNATWTQRRVWNRWQRFLQA
ncbi:glycosyltransferase [Levilactobacillus huananensis]|uniref:glycosyltransferase n=1 Tax=Levilactobacillus huananensis TaxID=2486019 RepID=UPI000F7B7A45|nr:glycosyltransferase [Levilactobacillus huananensis]